MHHNYRGRCLKSTVLYRGLGLFLEGPASSLHCTMKLAATDPTSSGCLAQVVIVDPSSPDLSYIQSNESYKTERV